MQFGETMQNKYVRDSHCGWCGSVFSENEMKRISERACDGCKKITWYNPLPVSVSLIKVTMDRASQAGVLLVKRAGEVEKPWAFPGGYINKGEPWKVGASREILEETGLNIPPEDIILMDVKDATTTPNLLIFNTSNKIYTFNKISFTPNREVSDIEICYSPKELTFPTHTQALYEYFNRSV